MPDDGSRAKPAGATRRGDHRRPYVALLLCSAAPHPWTPRFRTTQQGLYIKDEVTGYRLAPDYHGFYDDTIVRAEIRTNSLGHRDEEPRPGGTTNILLIGDSFTFGLLLDQSEMIDNQIEHVSDGRIRAYNTGVNGYGPPSILETLARCDWYQGSAVVYLFYSNDMRDDNLLPDQNRTSYEGYLVTQRKDDGTPFTPDEYADGIKTAVRATRWPTAVNRVVVLHNIWHRFGRRRWQLQSSTNEAMTPDHPDLLPRAMVVDGKIVNFFPRKAFGFVEAMRAKARERDMTFRVLIAPSRVEARSQMYSAKTSEFLELLRRIDIPIIEILQRVSADYYYDHDEHFNPGGARRRRSSSHSGCKKAVTARNPGREVASRFPHRP